MLGALGRGRGARERAQQIAELSRRSNPTPVKQRRNHSQGFAGGSYEGAFQGPNPNKTKAQAASTQAVIAKLVRSGRGWAKALSSVAYAQPTV